MDTSQTQGKEPISLYLATLNNGWLRKEFSYKVLPWMQRTPGVRILWEDPNETWSSPISSNRNLVTLRFLQTDCQFLLMLDNDVVPQFNPAELVFADRDIIGCPAKVRGTGQLIAWTAYYNHISGEGYSTVDLNVFDDFLDMIPVEIVGTGCILIKRRVLEDTRMKAPFHSEFDENGVQTYGTDFAFCRKARRAGYEVHTTIQRRCEHFKTVGLNDITGWDTTDNFSKVNATYGIPWAGMSITVKDWLYLQDLIRIIKPRRILEFGTGLSSLLLAEYAEVDSYETDEEQAKKIRKLHWDWCQAQDPPRPVSLHIHLWDGQEVPHSMLLAYDFAFVDGPEGEGRGGIGRRRSIQEAAIRCRHVVVHDAGREYEQRWQRESLRGKYRLVSRSGEHTTRCQYWLKRDQEITNSNFKEVLGIK